MGGFKRYQRVLVRRLSDHEIGGARPTTSPQNREIRTMPATIRTAPAARLRKVVDRHSEPAVFVDEQ
jgi:hypothetical protein